MEVLVAGSGADQFFVIRGDVFGQCADFEVIITDLGDWRHLGCRPSQLCLFEPFEFVRHDMAFVNFDAFLRQHFNHSLAGQAV